VSDPVTSPPAPMSVAELKAVLDRHRKWLRGEDGGAGADLRGADLTRADLRGADLRGAVLTGAVLTGAVLTGAVLRDADLTGAVLTGADLRDAVLRGAVLTGAVLTGAVLTGADLTRADLTRADLTGADLRDAVLTGADLTGADLTRADLTRADLTRADLRDAVLTGADLRDAVLRDADLTGAVWTFDGQRLPIDVIPDLRGRVLGAVESVDCSLDMQRWHTCATTHCLAGWVTTVHPQGKLIEAFLSPSTAAAIILDACGEPIPDFYDTKPGCDARAMNWLRTGRQEDPAPETAT
jgi:uncharacterized protein YjbI with pentapeptide repeats